MKKIILVFLVMTFAIGVILVAMPGTSHAGKIEAPKGEVAIGAAKKFVLYGYIKFRVGLSDKWDDGSGGAFDPRRIPLDNTTAGENAKLSFNARETRFGFRLTGDTFSGWKTGGKMEFDMYSGDSNHDNEAPRMRIGEIYLTKNNTKITLGKGWAMFGTRRGPTVENFNSMLGHGFRRGLRFDIAQKFPSGDNTFGAELMVMTYDDDNGFNTENLGFPYTSIELSMVSKSLGYAGGKPLGLWLQGIYGNMAEPGDIYENGIKVRSGKDYDVYGGELDWYFPILSSKNRAQKCGNLAFSGAVWMGQALGNACKLDMNYTIATKPSGGLDEVGGWGGWTGLTYWITENVWASVFVGYESIDDKDYYPRDWINDGTEITGNIFWQPCRSLVFCIEYAYIKNNYIGTDEYGNDDVTFNSLALAAYYYF